MKFIIIRHGQTDGNLRGIVQGAGVDLPLNDTGRAQAAACGERLKACHLPIIYCSSMLRARQTAEIIVRKTGCPLPAESVPGLEEVHFGEAEGKLSEDIHRQYADLLAVINDVDNPRRFDVSLPGGESIRQSTARGLQALQAIAAAATVPVVGVVSHGALMYNLYYHFFKESRRFENCEFFEAEI